MQQMLEQMCSNQLRLETTVRANNLPNQRTADEMNIDQLVGSPCDIMSDDIIMTMMICL
jgi:hypothetical protein